MWIRKSSEEQSAEKRAATIRNLSYIILLYAVGSYLLICAGELLGREVSIPAAAGGGIILTALILAFVSVVGAERRLSFRHTLVCERCNCVKRSDGDSRCSCGGNYFSLLQMKWSNSAVEQPHSGFQRPTLEVVS